MSEEEGPPLQSEMDAGNKRDKPGEVKTEGERGETGKDARKEGKVDKGEVRRAMEKAVKALEEGTEAGKKYLKAGTGMEPPPPKPKEEKIPTSKKQARGEEKYL